jgi:DNA-binding SARP family transcriptional activator
MGKGDSVTADVVEYGPARFRLLGSVEASIRGEQIALSGQQRSLLAVLLLHAGQELPVRLLMDMIWGQRTPTSPETRVRVLVSDLRKRLRNAGRDLIVTRPAGYLLSARRIDLDLDAFTREARQGRSARGAGRPAEAAGHYDRALALWRGPALGGISGPFAEAEALRLEEVRLQAVEERAAVLLVLGRHGELIGDLTRLIAEHPLREQPHLQLMTALHRGGRRSDALEVFRALRTRYVEELGLEPGPELQRLHREILADEAVPAPGRPAARAVPRPPARQLPADTPSLVGRDAEMERLDAFSTGHGRLVLVVGAAGTGKTALAVHWAHRRAARFPGGQFFVDMHGFGAGQRKPATEALTQLLGAMGIPADEVPGTTDAQIGLLRSQLAGRRALLVLDDVADPDQVRPLLPGDPGSLVVVTSRDRLGGLVALDGARRLALDILAPEAATALLAEAAGADRIAADPEGAAELARLCGYLPLALRIIGGRLADQPHRTLRGPISELGASGRLGYMQVDDDVRASVRGAFDLSYRALPQAAQRMFRLLSTVPTPGGLSTAAGAALAGVGVEEAGRLLDALARLHLVTSTGDGRFSCHDLLLEFAGQLTAGSAERDQAVHRLLDFYLHSVDAAALHMQNAYERPVRGPAADGSRPLTFAGPPDAHNWLDAEWDNMVAALGHAASTGLHTAAWRLAEALDPHGYLHLRAARSDWLAVLGTALDSACRTGDPRGEAALRRCRGLLLWYLGEFDSAAREHDRAIVLARRAGWRQGEAAALRGKGASLVQLSRGREAIALFEQALGACIRLGDQMGIMANLNNLAATHRELGDLDEAARHLAALSQGGSLQMEVMPLGTLGQIRHAQGRLKEATAALERSVALSRASGGSRRYEAESLIALAAVHRDARRYDEALAGYADLLVFARQTGDPLTEILALNGLAGVEIRLGRAAQAVTHLESALDLITRTGYRLGHVEALVTLATAHCRLGHEAPATEWATQALALARKYGPDIAEAEAHSALAEIHLRFGRPELCVDHALLALGVQRRCGFRIAQIHTIRLLGESYDQCGRASLARSLRSAGHRLWREAVTGHAASPQGG